AHPIWSENPTATADRIPADGHRASAHVAHHPVPTATTQNVGRWTFRNPPAWPRIHAPPSAPTTARLSASTTSHDGAVLAALHRTAASATAVGTAPSAKYATPAAELSRFESGGGPLYVPTAADTIPITTGSTAASGFGTGPGSSATAHSTAAVSAASA